MFDSAFLIRALNATLDGLLPHQFAELEIAREQRVTIEAETKSDAKQANVRADCGLRYDEKTGRIVRR